jgi:hypothetical protein
MIPENVVRIRQNLCRGRCNVDPTDPCAICPNGHWGRYTNKDCEKVQAQNEPGLGDKIAKFATPIARMIGSPCIDETTRKPKPDSGCGKMIKRLNEGMSLAEATKLRFKGE